MSLADEKLSFYNILVKGRGGGGGRLKMEREISSAQVAGWVGGICAKRARRLFACRVLVRARVCPLHVPWVHTHTHTHTSLQPITGCEQRHSCPQTHLLWA